MTYGFKRTTRSWPNPLYREEVAGEPVYPQHRESSALAHDTAGSDGGPGNPRRSVGRASQTPRDERYGDRPGRLGTLPPVPRRLIFLGGLAALGALFFALLTWQVSTGGRLVDGDWRVLRWFRRSAAAHPDWDTPAHYFCKLGNIEAAVPVLLAAVCLTAWLGRRAGLRRWWLPPLAAALAMGVLPIVVSVVKSAVARPAPGLTHETLDGYGYFPSGHTATSAVGYGAAALLVLPWLRRRAARAALAAATVLLLATVGAALVWCNYHWPLDVLGSWALTVTLLSGVAAAQVLTGPVGGSDPADEPADESATVN